MHFVVSVICYAVPLKRIGERGAVDELHLFRDFEFVLVCHLFMSNL